MSKIRTAEDYLETEDYEKQARKKSFQLLAFFSNLSPSLTFSHVIELMIGKKYRYDWYILGIKTDFSQVTHSAAFGNCLHV